MPTDSHTLPRQKEFKYRVEFNGFTSFLVQEFDPGDMNIGTTEHAGAGQNHPSKEGGFLTYEPATLRYVVPLVGADRTFWEEWMKKIQDPSTGNGDVPATYRKDFTLFELGPNGEVVKQTYFVRSFPIKYKKGSRSSMQDKRDTIEEVQIEYEYREPRAA